jgi:hypothetical protein
MDPMQGELSVQRLSIETQHSRGGGLVAGHVAQRADDVLAFDVGETPPFCEG